MEIWKKEEVTKINLRHQTEVKSTIVFWDSNGNIDEVEFSKFLIELSIIINKTQDINKLYNVYNYNQLINYDEYPCQEEMLSILFSNQHVLVQNPSLLELSKELCKKKNLIIHLKHNERFYPIEFSNWGDVIGTDWEVNANDISKLIFWDEHYNIDIGKFYRTVHLYGYSVFDNNNADDLYDIYVINEKININQFISIIMTDIKNQYKLDEAFCNKIMRNINHFLETKLLNI